VGGRSRRQHRSRQQWRLRSDKKKVSPLTLLSFEAFHSMEEVMNSINWTKFYDLYVQNEHFKVFIVKDDTNCFHAGCLWYEVERVLRVQGEPGNFRIAFETRADTNEQAALDQLKAWVTSKFGKDFKLVPSK
jgi:hypothetical protein